METAMPTRSRLIAACLPELRRYAHALFGSRQSGDGRLRVMLETLLQSSEDLGPGMSKGGDPRRELFKLFHRVVHTLECPLDRAADDHMPERRLRDAVATLPLLGREALLLTSLSGFDVAQVADILGIARAGVERALADARRQVRAHLKARILIVDDQARTAARLEHVVEKLGHAVVGVVPSDGAAIDAVRERRPEIVITDLHGRSGVKAEDHIRSAVDAPVVSLREAQPRRTGSRRAAARGAARKVTARNVGDALSDALAAPAVVKANVLRG
jgi:CheY-like chemotaxis protein